MTSFKVATISALIVVLHLSSTATAHAGTIFGFTGAGLAGGLRWDADPLTVNIGGTNYERSLDGGLRYSLEGGSYEAFRDMFSWTFVPTAAEFEQAITQAFAAWTVVDPATGFGTNLTFVSDFATPVEGDPLGGDVNARGAEIDLLASTNGIFWDPGNNGTQAETFFDAVGALPTLTSGTPDYGSGAISGADITINNNPGAIYTLDLFRRLLTHEIGHALGLGDVEGDISGNTFIDDNFDATSSATALATLTNSWAAMVNVFDPASSPLSRYTVPFGDPGTLTAGVDILMESRGLGLSPGNPIDNLTPLTNDEFGTRQFLYPFVAQQPVPEPATLLLLGSGCVGAALRRRYRRR